MSGVTKTTVRACAAAHHNHASVLALRLGVYLSRDMSKAFVQMFLWMDRKSGRYAM